jgi:hypothetical protein
MAELITMNGIILRLPSFLGSTSRDAKVTSCDVSVGGSEVAAGVGGGVDVTVEVCVSQSSSKKQERRWRGGSEGTAKLRGLGEPKDKAGRMP